MSNIGGLSTASSSGPGSIFVTTYLCGTIATVTANKTDDILSFSKIAAKRHKQLFGNAIGNPEIISVINVATIRSLRLHGKVKDQLKLGDSVWLITSQEWKSYCSSYFTPLNSPMRHGKLMIPRNPTALGPKQLKEFIRVHIDEVNKKNDIKGIVSNPSTSEGAAISGNDAQEATIVEDQQTTEDNPIKSSVVEEIAEETPISSATVPVTLVDDLEEASGEVKTEESTPIVSEIDSQSTQTPQYQSNFTEQTPLEMFHSVIESEDILTPMLSFQTPDNNEENMADVSNIVNLDNSMNEIQEDNMNFRFEDNEKPIVPNNSSSMLEVDHKHETQIVDNACNGNEQTSVVDNLMVDVSSADVKAEYVMSPQSNCYEIQCTDNSILEQCPDNKLSVVTSTSPLSSPPLSPPTSPSQSSSPLSSPPSSPPQPPTSTVTTSASTEPPSPPSSLSQSREVHDIFHGKDSPQESSMEEQLNIDILVSKPMICEIMPADNSNNDGIVVSKDQSDGEFANEDDSNHDNEMVNANVHSIGDAESPHVSECDIESVSNDNLDNNNDKVADNIPTDNEKESDNDNVSENNSSVSVHNLEVDDNNVYNDMDNNNDKRIDVVEENNNDSINIDNNSVNEKVTIDNINNSNNSNDSNNSNNCNSGDEGSYHVKESVDKVSEESEVENNNDNNDNNDDESLPPPPPPPISINEKVTSTVSTPLSLSVVSEDNNEVMTSSSVNNHKISQDLEELESTEDVNDDRSNHGTLEIEKESEIHINQLEEVENLLQTAPESEKSSINAVNVHNDVTADNANEEEGKSIDKNSAVEMERISNENGSDGSAHILNNGESTQCDDHSIVSIGVHHVQHEHLVDSECTVKDSDKGADESSITSKFHQEQEHEEKVPVVESRELIADQVTLVVCDHSKNNCDVDGEVGDNDLQQDSISDISDDFQSEHGDHEVNADLIQQPNIIELASSRVEVGLEGALTYTPRDDEPLNNNANSVDLNNSIIPNTSQCPGTENALADVSTSSGNPHYVLFLEDRISQLSQQLEISSKYQQSLEFRIEEMRLMLHILVSGRDRDHNRDLPQLTAETLQNPYSSEKVAIDDLEASIRAIDESGILRPEYASKRFDSNGINYLNRTTRTLDAAAENNEIIRSNNSISNIDNNKADFSTANNSNSNNNQFLSQKPTEIIDSSHYSNNFSQYVNQAGNTMSHFNSFLDRTSPVTLRELNDSPPLQIFEQPEQFVESPIPKSSNMESQSVNSNQFLSNTLAGFKSPKDYEDGSDYIENRESENGVIDALPQGLEENEGLESCNVDDQNQQEEQQQVNEYFEQQDINNDMIEVNNDNLNEIDMVSSNLESIDGPLTIDTQKSSDFEHLDTPNTLSSVESADFYFRGNNRQFDFASSLINDNSTKDNGKRNSPMKSPVVTIRRSSIRAAPRYRFKNHHVNNSNILTYNNGGSSAVKDDSTKKSGTPKNRTVFKPRTVAPRSYSAMHSPSLRRNSFYRCYNNYLNSQESERSNVNQESSNVVEMNADDNNVSSYMPQDNEQSCDFQGNEMPQLTQDNVYIEDIPTVSTDVESMEPNESSEPTETNENTLETNNIEEDMSLVKAASTDQDDVTPTVTDSDTSPNDRISRLKAALRAKVTAKVDNILNSVNSTTEKPSTGVTTNDNTNTNTNEQSSSTTMIPFSSSPSDSNPTVATSATISFSKMITLKAKELCGGAHVWTSLPDEEREHYQEQAEIALKSESSHPSKSGLPDFMSQVNSMKGEVKPSVATSEKNKSSQSANSNNNKVTVDDNKTWPNNNRRMSLVYQGYRAVVSLQLDSDESEEEKTSEPNAMTSPEAVVIDSTLVQADVNVDLLIQESDKEAQMKFEQNERENEEFLILEKSICEEIENSMIEGDTNNALFSDNDENDLENNDPKSGTLEEICYPIDNKINEQQEKQNEDNVKTFRNSLVGLFKAVDDSNTLDNAEENLSYFQAKPFDENNNIPTMEHKQSDNNNQTQVVTDDIVDTEKPSQSIVKGLEDSRESLVEVKSASSDDNDSTNTIAISTTVDSASVKTNLLTPEKLAKISINFDADANTSADNAIDSDTETHEHKAKGVLSIVITDDDLETSCTPPASSREENKPRQIDNKFTAAELFYLPFLLTHLGIVNKKSRTGGGNNNTSPSRQKSRDLNLSNIPNSNNNNSLIMGGSSGSGGNMFGNGYAAPLVLSEWWSFADCIYWDTRISSDALETNHRMYFDMMECILQSIGLTRGDLLLWTLLQLYATRDRALIRYIRVSQVSQMLREAGLIVTNIQIQRAFSQAPPAKAQRAAAPEKIQLKSGTIVTVKPNARGNSQSTHNLISYDSFRNLLKIWEKIHVDWKDTINLRDKDSPTNKGKKLNTSKDSTKSASTKQLVSMLECQRGLQSLLSKRDALFRQLCAQSVLCFSGVILNTIYTTMLSAHFTSNINHGSNKVSTTHSNNSSPSKYPTTPVPKRRSSSFIIQNYHNMNIISNHMNSNFNFSLHLQGENDGGNSGSGDMKDSTLIKKIFVHDNLADIESVKSLWDKNFEQLRLIFQSYCGSPEPRRPLVFNKSSIPTSNGVLGNSNSSNNGGNANGNAAGNSGGSAAMNTSNLRGQVYLMNMEAVRECLSDFGVFPMLVDLQSLVRLFQGVKAWEWSLADRFLQYSIETRFNADIEASSNLNSPPFGKSSTWNSNGDLGASFESVIGSHISHCNNISHNNSNNASLCSPNSSYWNSAVAIRVLEGGQIEGDTLDFVATLGHFSLTLCGFQELLSRIAFECLQSQHSSKTPLDPKIAVSTLLHVMDESGGKAKLAKTSRKTLASIRNFVYK